MLKLIARGTAVGVGIGLMIGCALAGLVGAVVGGSVGLGVGGLVMTALTLGGAFSDRYPRRARRVEFDCPHSRRHVDAKLLQNTDTEKVFEIETCSVFSPPTEIRCKKRCLDDLNAGVVVAH